MTLRQLYYGDNLQVLRDHIKDESVDLIYLDPPFNSNASYNILFKEPTGEGSESQLEAFTDTWQWNESAELAFDEVRRSGNVPAFELLDAMRRFLGQNAMMAYLTMMAVRLIELHRVLKPTGSIYLHCDPTASHYLKLLMDAVFGFVNYRNEIIWKRTSGHSDARGFGAVHDVILFYTKTEKNKWNETYQPYDDEYIEQYYRYVDADGRKFMSGDLGAAGLQGGGYEYEWKNVKRIWRVPRKTMEKLEKEGKIFHTRNGIPRIKRYLDEAKGMPTQDLWTDIEALRSWHQERLGYPTQKPLALLERILAASSKEGDVVLDPFCGCGTTVHAAEKLHRQWIGIDITYLAISPIERRLSGAFPEINYEIIGAPKDLASAEHLARINKFQFECWAITQVGAWPRSGKPKKGADAGIDGIIYFAGEGKRTERAVVQVKAGANTTVSMIRDLKGVMEREKAPIGVFITVSQPTRKMEEEAAATGVYEGVDGKTYPRLQIITLAEIFQGKKPRIPLVDPGAGFKRARREEPKNGELNV